MSVDEAVPAQSDNQPVKQKITLEDCKLHNKEEDCWLVISGKVYDVTEFLDEHPGGFDIVLAATGKDATEDFEEIGHSNAAREMLDKYYVGEFQGGEQAAKQANSSAHASAKQVQAKQSGSNLQGILPFLPVLFILVAVLVGYQFLGKQ
ncbi:hypothetical protein ABBQ32_006216 [Trebouxia sp. C0010 RCD-2024]